MPGGDEKEIGAVATWYSPSKTRPPQSSILLVSRPRLIQALDACLERDISFIIAPAGFGKSTLLAQWRARLVEQSTPCGWISLDEADAQARQFLAYVVFALDAAGVNVGRLTIDADNGFIDSSLDFIAANIISAIKLSPQRIVLILDDYHRLQSSGVDEILHEVMSQCTDKIHIAIGSRERPQLNVSTLLASGKATEVGAVDLRFSDDEVRAAIGAEISDEVFASLQKKVEGWPVAVQLTKLLVTGKEDLASAITKLHGYSGHLASYLTDQVISGLPDDIQNFVLKTSILDSFNAELADSVCEHTSSGLLLKQLEPMQALLVPIDDDLKWYRYHHLFAECLQDLLKQRSGNEISLLHIKAAHWLCKNGFYANAVRHAREAGDYELCASIIGEAGGWELILFGGIGYLANLMAYIPDKEVRKYPRLLFAKTYLALKSGEIKTARAYFDAASSRDDVAVDPHVQRDQLNVGILLGTYEDAPLLEFDADRFRRSLEKVAPDDSITRGCILCQIALRHAAFGDFIAGSEVAHKAMRAMREGESLLGLNYSIIHAGMHALYAGKYQIAFANYEKAAEMAADNFGADSGLKYNADICLQSLSYWKSGIDEDAVTVLTNAITHSQQHDGWFEIFAIGFDALFHQAMQLNNFDRASEIIEKMRTTAADRGIQRLEHVCSAYQLHLFVKSGRMHDAAVEYERIREWLDLDSKESVERPWLPPVMAACSCARFLTATDRNEEALVAIDHALQSTLLTGAKFHEMRVLLVKATILENAKDRPNAVKALLCALELAAPYGIRQPFVSGATEKMLRASRGHLRGGDYDLILENFISDIIGQETADAGLLSDREMQVLEELAEGKSNKEIARALDMTENTVKFHLKNVFSKLGVTRRIQAVTRARDMQYID